MTCLLLLALLQLSASPKAEPDQAALAITAGGAYATVERLASPIYSGRLTGTPGYEAAARWTASEFRRAGLKAPKEFPDHLQPFPLKLGGLESATLEVLPGERSMEKPRQLEFFKDYMPMLESGSCDLTAEVVFAGFGITAPELGRDDYEGLDVKGKAVLLARGAPDDGRDWKGHNSTSARVTNAHNHGAAAMFLVDSAVLSVNGERIEGLGTAMVGSELADSLLEGTSLKMEALRKVLSKGGRASFSTGKMVHYIVKAKPVLEMTGYNVLGILPGRDPSLPGEFVVLGAHLDHIGDWPSLNPGANDNASGSAAVLEMAKACKALKSSPRRSLVLALFGGEEEGLLGAKHLAGHPPAGLTKCVGMFNLDMVGQGTGIYVSGGLTFPELGTALEESRDRLAPGMKIKAGASMGEARADHGPFQAAGIQAVGLFGAWGVSHGYHTPEDTLWWLTPKSIESIGRVTFSAAIRVADQE